MNKRTFTVQQDDIDGLWYVIQRRNGRDICVEGTRKTQAGAIRLANKLTQQYADAPEPGKVYRLTGAGNVPAISNGNSWAESEVKE